MPPFNVCDFDQQNLIDHILLSCLHTLIWSTPSVNKLNLIRLRNFAEAFKSSAHEWARYGL